MPGGRPRKQPADYLPKLCQALELGAWYWLACRYAGVSYTTFHTWMLAGETEDADPAMQAFVRRIHQAEATAALRQLHQIAEAAAQDWHAAMWLLERVHPVAYHQQVVEQRHRGEVEPAGRVLVHRYGQPTPDA